MIYLTLVELKELPDISQSVITVHMRAPHLERKFSLNSSQHELR